MTHQVRCVRCASGKANRRSPLPGDRSRIASQWLMAGAVLWRSLRRVSTSSETLGARYSVNGVAKEHATSSGSSLNLADAGFGPVSGGNIQGLDLLGSLRGRGATNLSNGPPVDPPSSESWQQPTIRCLGGSSGKEQAVTYRPQPRRGAVGGRQRARWRGPHSVVGGLRSGPDLYRVRH